MPSPELLGKTAAFCYLADHCLASIIILGLVALNPLTTALVILPRGAATLPCEYTKT